MAEQRYSIIEKIDAGGMAEVWKARSTSIQGFEKLIAIKRVLPALSRKQKFLEMFLDEARLSLYLNHANIVQTFDIGRSASSYFIVMEWVDGANLKSILDIMSIRQLRLPIEQALFIALEICRALHHAHNRKDPQGNPLCIVHRDISPPNVLISREGEVKLVDFGLAKAASQISQTDPGIVKGKFSYLSPESAMGKPIDLRSDIFAVGILIWEMLAGRHLFDGPNDLATVKLVRATRVPPLHGENRKVDLKLEAIVNKALTHNPEDRYQNAKTMGEALSSYLFEHQLKVTAWDIAATVEQVLHLKRMTRPVNIPEVSSSLEATIQEEVNRLTSIEDLARMEFRSMRESAGAQQRSSGEDPRQWAEEMGVEEDDDRTIVDSQPQIALIATQPHPRTIELRPQGEERRIEPLRHADASSQTRDLPRSQHSRQLQPQRTGNLSSQVTGRHHTLPQPPFSSLPQGSNTSQLSNTLLGVGLGILTAALLGGFAWFLFFR